MWSRFSHPSPALVVATIALIVALGGTSYAALSNNSVGTNQLKNGAVGYLVKDTDPAELLRAVRSVARPPAPAS